MDRKELIFTLFCCKDYFSWRMLQELFQPFYLLHAMNIICHNLYRFLSWLFLVDFQPLFAAVLMLKWCIQVSCSFTLVLRSALKMNTIRRNNLFIVPFIKLAWSSYFNIYIQNDCNKVLWSNRGRDLEEIEKEMKP